jgi:N-formylglutamate deformylase
LSIVQLLVSCAALRAGSNLDRADICIGTDSFHTPSLIRDAIVAVAKGEGYSVAVDAPFSGALVRLSSYRKDHRILSVMIEMNRRLYMDEDSGQKTRDFATVRAAVGRIIVIAAKAAAKAGSPDVCSTRRS